MKIKLNQELGMAMSLNILLQEFNEEHWHNFVATCSNEVEENIIVLGELNVPKDISIALFWRLRDHTYKWLFKPVPALNYVTPIELLKSEDGKKILKAALMQMPD